VTDRDRMELRRDLRSGNTADDAKDRADIRRDEADLRRDRHDLRGDLHRRR
jgi:hypothetical protein